MTSAIVQMNKITLRCKPECNAILIGWHGILKTAEKTAVTFYTCPKCGRSFEVESEYDPEVDCMILVSHREVRHL